MSGQPGLTVVHRMTPAERRQWHLLEMNRAVTMIQMETQTAAREMALGGWMSDHPAAVSHWNRHFEEHKTELLKAEGEPV